MHDEPTSSGSTTTLAEPDWAALRRQLSGDLSLPGEPGYDTCLPWNRRAEVHPAAVVAAVSAEDMARTVRWAARSGKRVAVQSTGHAAVDMGDGVVLVLTNRLDELSIDADARTARFGAGVLWQRVLEAAGPQGLAPVAGSSPIVGAVGFLSGGGTGPFSRALGLGSDRVREFEVVTGDGELRTASADQEPDLFWALRGGKATAGFVTAATVSLQSFGSFFGGGVYFGTDDAAAVLRAWPAWAEQLPAEATTSVALLQLPPLPTIPEPLAGRMTLALRFTWLGDPERGRELVAPMLALADPVLGAFDVMPVAAAGAVHADPTEPGPSIEDGFLMRGFDGDAVEALLAAAGPGSGSAVAITEVRQMGGAMATAPQVPDAYDGREAPWNLSIIAVPAPGAPPAGPSMERVMTAMRPWSFGLAQPNFIVTDDPADMGKFYRAETLRRLAEVGDRYDPEHVIDVGQVVRTAAAAAAGAAV